MNARLGRRRFIGGTASVLGLLASPAWARATKVPGRLRPGDFVVVASGLDHPEGVAASPDGSLFFSSGGGALSVRSAEGAVRHIGQAIAPNGVAIDRQGRALVANMGLLKQRPGILQRIDPVSGAIEILASAVEGRTLVASNGPVVARDGTIYCTHSTWGPVANIGTTVAAGFIYRVAPGGAVDVIARGLRGVNGLALSRDERWLYASLTASARIRRWPRKPDGTLGEGADFGPQLGVAVPDHDVAAIRALPAAERAKLGYPDGIAFDAAGNLWITLPFANKLAALTPTGRLIELFHDPEGAKIEMPTNLCWGGADLRDLYVVSRRGGTILKARTAIAGAPLANWPQG